MINQIILGDCFEVLSKMDKNSVDLILTDPPYNISKSSNFTKNSNNTKFNKISIDFGEWDKEELDLDKLFSHICSGEFCAVSGQCAHLAAQG